MTYDESGRAARCRVVTALLAVVIIVLVGANLCIGSVLVPADHIPGILSGGAANSMEIQIIWEIRLPRVLSAVLLGGALYLSGFLLQTFFNNPIADPFILGVSSGAKFVVALTMIVLWARTRPCPRRPWWPQHFWARLSPSASCSSSHGA